jgi:hypothetical protein
LRFRSKCPQKFLLSITKSTHSTSLKEALPWQKPKPICDDPAIENKLEAIIDNSGYVPAIEDIDFLDGFNEKY